MKTFFRLVNSQIVTAKPQSTIYLGHLLSIIKAVVIAFR